MRPSRLLAAAVVGPLAGGILALIPAPALAQQQDPVAAAEQALKDRSDGKVTVRKDDRGVVHFVGSQPGKPVERHPGVLTTDSPARQAAGYLKRYGALWALDHAGSDVRVARTRETAKGAVARFQQTVDGMPVLGGELAVALDAAGNLQSVSGETTPLALPTAARPITEARAQQTAVTLAARLNEVSESALRASAPEAYAYDATLLGPAARDAGLVPVWKVEVTGPAHVRHLVLVDRTRGSVVLQFNQVHAAADRMVCDRENVRDTTNANGDPKLAVCIVQAGTTDRAEGGAPSTQADVNAAYDYTGDTAGFFQTQFNVDLTQMIGYGSTPRLRSTVRYCLPAAHDPQCPMKNAFWNGNGVYYGQGMPKADDIVAHELTHGVIEKTADLAYWYQSGAINESMADIFGELVDLTNTDAETESPWNLGEGSPFPGGGQIRDMENPGLYGQPDRMTSGAYHDAPWTSNAFDNGGVHVNSGVGNKAAYLIARPASDGPVSFNGHTITGIGHDKAARVYYESLQILTSGADYEDLYSVLPQACSNLAAGGVGGITPADCTTVSAAVQATEMNQQPVVDAKAPEAPVCDTGTKKNLFLDGFEGSLSNWSRTSGMWPHVEGYARSGNKSLYGYEPNQSYGDPLVSTARLARNFVIPSGVKTYLRFDHQFLLWFDPDTHDYDDGALLTYSTDGGKSFKSTSALPWVNGPNRTITPWNGSPSYTGWGGDSHGYMSSRVDVSSLAGKSVMFRWRLTGDPEVSLDGWTLDNINLYLCGGDTPSNATGVTGVGGVGQATVKWQPPVWPGSSPITKYTVTVHEGSTLVATYDDISPSATSKLVTGLARGHSYTFTVRPSNVSGTGPAASKKLIGTKQSSALSPTTIYKGSSTKFSGKLIRSDTSAGLRGLKVTIQYRKKGSTGAFTDLETKTTSSTGGYSFTRAPSSSTEYRVVYKSGSSTYLGSYSAIRTVTVRS